jgi:hypothetical protein
VIWREPAPNFWRGNWKFYIWKTGLFFTK